MHRYLARRAGREHADDLASQTFTVAFARRHTFRSEATSALPWLLGIATNLLSDDRRSEQRLLATIARLREEPGLRTAGGADAAGGGAAIDGELAQALAGLEPAQRDVLLLHAWGELSYEEIAESLAIAPGTVRSRLSRARATLRARLGAGAGDPHREKEG